ncbi:uncharacterized protein SPPG_09342 [Spizellomyces punctatus DAOM BR117]|uniref:Uncharacterized protein n=1 Tax=Spizellomyces punctatus (strain DAOM BR117) TaxID=645134 RepID=A0A0L0HBM1_SPIPD|nr:uncharacterized protein SPPG_09342 [Spizellomyces punctatus DAOM BR117]KNC98341.1 hypothetical protein SPPG_09342 [Spizellomyces punctatus DAOM BR117]|eukprot:XP_016606381.1 hypothetical protein SPPG_09342 [Spizellomyces punctatus DAOM BR117]
MVQCISRMVPSLVWMYGRSNDEIAGSTQAPGWMPAGAIVVYDNGSTVIAGSAAVCLECRVENLNQLRLDRRARISSIGKRAQGAHRTFVNPNYLGQHSNRLNTLWALSSTHICQIDCYRIAATTLSCALSIQ